MRIELHDSPSALQELAESWDSLLAQSANDTIFLTWEWCYAWWMAYGNSRSLFILSAWDGQELIGIAPFYVAVRQSWGKVIRELRIIGDGSGDSDYLDIFAKREREREVISAALEFLDSVAKRWDCIRIDGAPAQSVCLSAMKEIAKDRGWKTAAEDIPSCSLDLPCTWDQYLGSLQPRVRTKIRSALNCFENELSVIPVECESVDDISGWLTQLFELHTRRWKTDNSPGVFQDRRRQSFYREISELALPKGWLALYRLSWGDRPLALQYGFRYHNRFYLLQEGYEPSFKTLRPGVGLRAWVLRDGITSGLKQYDFLAGSARHKQEWGARTTQSRRLRLAKTREAAWVTLAQPALTKWSSEVIGTLVPDTIKRWRRELIGRKKQRWESTPFKTGLLKQTGRWFLSRLYLSTPVGEISRQIADQFSRRGTERPALLHNLARGRSAAASVCTIFRYHRVNNDHDPFFDALPVDEFRTQMEYLARHFHLVSLDDLAAGRPARKDRRSCVAITFDDGYRDNYVHAFPILQSLGIPATIFLTTGYIQSGRLPWYDQVRLAFKLTMKRTFSMQAIGGAEVELHSDAARLRALKLVLGRLRLTPDSDRVRWLPQLFEDLRVPCDLNLPATMLTWNQIRHMSKKGIGFGAHTVTHPVLGGLSLSQQQAEITGSKQTVEEKLQIQVRHFAYPFGKAVDFGGDAKRIVRAAGYQTAVTTIAGVNGPEQDPLELKRFNLREPDQGLFGLKLDWSRIFANTAA